MELCVSLGLIKSPARAMQKAALCYGGDVSRLVDLCRARVGFGGLADLSRFLERVATECSIVRIKNMMGSSQSRPAAHVRNGYKAVIVNLCIDNEETRGLGVENHVCELQLILLGFGRAKRFESGDSGLIRHDNYVTYRIARSRFNSLDAIVLNFSRLVLASITFIRGRSGKISSAEEPTRLELMITPGPSFACRALAPSVDIEVEAPLPPCLGAVLDPGHCITQPITSTETAKCQCFGQIERGNSFHSSEGSLPHVCCSAGEMSVYRCSSDPVQASFPVSTSLNSGSEHLRKRWRTSLLSRRSMDIESQDDAQDEPYEDGAFAMSTFPVFLMSCVQQGGFFDSKASKVKAAHHRSHAASVLFSSDPLAAAVSKRGIQIFLMLVSMFYCWRVYSTTTIISLGSIGAYRSNAIRMIPLSLRRSGDINISESISRFGLLQDGCTVNGGRLTFDRSQQAVTLTFDEKVSGNGYFFVTSTNSSPDLDPVNWVVEAIMDDNTTWMQVGASCWRQYSDGKLGLYPQLQFSTPVARGRTVIVDYRIPWQWFVDTLAANVIYSIGWFCSAVTGIVGREQMGKTVVMAMSISAALLFVSEAIGYHMDGLTYTAASIWIEYGPTQLIWIFGIAFFEAQFVWVLLFFSLSVLGTLIGRDTVLYGRPILVPMTSYMTSSGILVMIFVIVILYFRRRAISRALNLVTADKMRYDAAWTTVIADSDSLNSLLEMRRVVEELEIRCKHPARQLNRILCCCGRPNESSMRVTHQTRVTQKLARCYLRMDIMGKLEFSSPVRSLDQLFVQASCLEPLLREKVKAWATTTAGCFLLAARDTPDQDTFVRFDQIKDSGEAIRRIKWAQIKSADRAIEKISRAYKQDPSRLLDVCRQSIVFENATNLAACLSVIAMDPDVSVARIKNRLDPDFNSAPSAGYRSLALNLRIVTAEARRLGIEAHVAEVQLLLQPFAELKSEMGHRRYVDFRNLRGE